jgi:hypothetical protein
MSVRPELNKKLDSDTFRSFYYLKEELIEFCKISGLPVSGSKIEIINRIAHYLDTGEISQPISQTRVKVNIEEITDSSKIEENFICSEKHRAFFKEKIGRSFSFSVAFQKWLKNNAGETYAQAVEAYYMILEEKKKCKTTIDKQFEYNTYIRDFFADNKGRTLKDAIKCWNYKKGLQGHNRYEKEDLIVLS